MGKYTVEAAQVEKIFDIRGGWIDCNLPVSAERNDGICLQLSVGKRWNQDTCQRG